jgi:hypothetical protein
MLLLAADDKYSQVCRALPVIPRPPVPALKLPPSPPPEAAAAAAPGDGSGGFAAV